jgi:hypothetical protein
MMLLYKKKNKNSADSIPKIFSNIESRNHNFKNKTVIIKGNKNERLRR